MSPYRLAIVSATLTIVGLIGLLLGDGFADVGALTLASVPAISGLVAWRRAQVRKQGPVGEDG